MSHTITLTIDRWGVYSTFDCQAPPGAPCRRRCSGDCESWQVCDGDRGCEQCVEDPDLPAPHCAWCGKPMTATDCTALDGLNDGEWYEMYEGPGGVPLRSGPVEVWWDSSIDTYLWRYPG